MEQRALDIGREIGKIMNFAKEMSSSNFDYEDIFQIGNDIKTSCGRLEKLWIKDFERD